MNRRDFLSSTAATVLASRLSAGAERPQKGSSVLDTFDFQGVRLLPSMFSRQLEKTRETYYGIPNDNILKGFRQRAGLPAPGAGLDGWCSKTSAVVFGQWLSGMARMSRATGDSQLREKALTLVSEWAKTTASGRYGMDTYSYEKTVCGLVDLALYADYGDAWKYLDTLTRWADSKFDRSRHPGTPLDRDGRKPKGTLEWYTLSENLYRAYLASGNDLYKSFGDLWRYDSYWNQFENQAYSDDAKFLHSYSHANTFNSAAMTWAVTGDKRYLNILKNAHQYLTSTQCYASGGYGPGEWSVPNNGDLGNALDLRSDTAEIPCDTWGAFKLSKYLLRFTGEAKYGDWVEQLLYNGIGAALPVQPDGRSFYYADYRIGMAQKQYYWHHWPCCSGTYLQAVADYHDLIYFRDADGLYVNLFLPSEATWQVNGSHVTVRQETTFPDSDSTTFTVRADRPVKMTLRFRVPAWASSGLRVRVNGQVAEAAKDNRGWAAISRTWTSGDSVNVAFPLSLRLSPVDPQHPKRAAVLYGPLLLAQDARYTLPLVMQPDDDLSKRLVRQSNALEFRPTEIATHEQKTGKFLPYFSFPEGDPYRVYFDIDQFRFL